MSGTFAKISPYLPKNMDTELKSRYRELCDYLDERIEFNHVESEIHTKLHTARVLLYALLLAERILPNDVKAKKILAHASLFHDTRRIDDGLDTGHGARAAIHYKVYCDKNGIAYHTASTVIIKYHDLDDDLGITAMAKMTNSEYVKTLYAIFKDADALDRYRLGSSGLDPKFLRYQESINMMTFAEFLVDATS